MSLGMPEGKILGGLGLSEKGANILQIVARAKLSLLRPIHCMRRKNILMRGLKTQSFEIVQRFVSNHIINNNKSFFQN